MIDSYILVSARRGGTKEREPDVRGKNLGEKKNQCFAEDPRCICYLQERYEKL
jgi:hypothetical protein